MRKFLIPLLMAGVVLPTAAYARPNDRSDRQSERASEAKADRAERPERTERPERAERPNRSERAVRADRSERPVRVQRVERHDSERQVVRRQAVETRSDRHLRRDRPDNLAEAFQGVARRQRDGDGIQVRQRTTGDSAGIRTLERHHRDSNHRRWSSDWRRDHRYDWRNYRNRHRSLFRLGRYYDPYGWGYRRFSIGFNIGSSYYGSNYWLDDPWMYRLPPAYGPYRWVRYYDDALLVNIYTGQVVDVLHNFFW